MPCSDLLCTKGSSREIFYSNVVDLKLILCVFNIHTHLRLIYLSRFVTSSDVRPGFQSQGGSPHLQDLSLVCNRILRFTSSVTPVDLMVTSMAAGPFQSMYLRTKYWWGLSPGSIMLLPHSMRQDKCSTNCAMLAWLEGRYSAWQHTFSMLICMAH